MALLLINIYFGLGAPRKKITMIEISGLESVEEIAPRSVLFLDATREPISN